MGDLLPVLTAIGGTLTAAAAFVKALPRLRALGFGDSRKCIQEKAEMRADLEAAEEKVRILVGDVAERDEELSKVRSDLASALLNLDFARRSGNEARQELSDVRDEIRRQARSPKARTRASDR